MELNDMAKSSITGKKTYRKPTVQVYGTLSEITAATTSPGNPTQDGSPVGRGETTQQNRT